MPLTVRHLRVRTRVVLHRDACYAVCIIKRFAREHFARPVLYNIYTVHWGPFVIVFPFVELLYYLKLPYHVSVQKVKFFRGEFKNTKPPVACRGFCENLHAVYVCRLWPFHSL